jgi:hypothetical protein
MIDIPMKAQVQCADGIAGQSTYIVGNPTNNEITHLVVQNNLPPFHEYLVPIDEIDESTGGRIKLKCTRDDLHNMEPFEYEEYIRTHLPGYLRWDGVPAIPGFTTELVTAFIPTKCRNVPQDEQVLRHDAIVNATDGYVVGKVDKLLIDSNDMQVTHVVLVVRHIFEANEIVIPVSQIDHIEEDTIYLKLDRQEVKELTTTPAQHWSL